MKRPATMHIRIVYVITVLYFTSKMLGLASFKLTENHVTRRVLLNTKLRDNLLNNFSLLVLFNFVPYDIRGNYGP